MGGISPTMTTRDIVTAYIQAVEAQNVDEVDRLMHPEIENLEHPNKMLPAGKRYDLAAMRAAGERGRAVMASQRFEIRSMIVEGNRAAERNTRRRSRSAARRSRHACSGVQHHRAQGRQSLASGAIRLLRVAHPYCTWIVSITVFIAALTTSVSGSRTMT
jgi:predicted ester cyclase